MNDNITIHYALFISEGTRFFTSTERLSSIQNKIDATTRNCISSFVSFGKKTKYEQGAFLYGTFTDTQSQHDYFVLTFVVSRPDELAKRDTNFRYQAILPLTDFKALCAAGYDIKSIIKTIFTKKLLILKNKSHNYQPELAKPMTPKDIKQIELFDYQLGLKQVKAQFQDQTLFEDSLTALIYDKSFQIHFGKVDSLSPDWDKDSADLTKRTDSKGEAFVSALWHLLPLQTRMHRGVSTGLPDKNDAMHKACQAKNIVAIALQFQNSTALMNASKQALKRIDTHAKGFQTIKTHYVKPLVAAIEANHIKSVLELQNNYTIEDTSQPNKVQATVSKTSSKSDVDSKKSKVNHTFLKWLPIGIIAFLSLTILFLLVNQNPSHTNNGTQIVEWQQSHNELTEIKQTVLVDQTQWSVNAFLQDWNAQKRSKQELTHIKQAVNAEQLSNEVFIENITNWKAQAEKQPDTTQHSEWQKAHQDLAKIKQAFDADEWTSEALISHIRNLKLESETANQQLGLLQALLLQDWDGAKIQINTLGSTHNVIATQANDLVRDIVRWQKNSAAYEKAQTDTAQSTNQKRLQKEHRAMQSVLNALRDKEWKKAKDKSDAVNDEQLSKVISTIEYWSIDAQEYDKIMPEVNNLLTLFKVTSLRDVKGKLTRAESKLTETQIKLHEAQGNLKTVNKELNTVKPKVQQLEEDIKEKNSTIVTKDDELEKLKNKLADLDKLANKLGAEKAETFLTELAQNNQKVQDLLAEAKTSIIAKALNDLKGIQGNHRIAKEIYFEILSLSPNNPYVEATVGLYYGIPEKYKDLGWGYSPYKNALKNSTTLQPYLAKFKFNTGSVDSELKRAERFLENGNISLAINAYRDILSQNADVESAKFGLTVLVPLYYLLNNKIGQALSHLKPLRNNEQSNHYMLVKNLISKIDEHYQRLVVAENKNKAILSSINEYHALFERSLLNRDNFLQQYRTALNRIEPKVQEVFDIVDGSIDTLVEKNNLVYANQQISSAYQKTLSDNKRKMLSILNLDDCAIQTDSWGYKWIKPICITGLRTQLRQF